MSLFGGSIKTLTVKSHGELSGNATHFPLVEDHFVWGLKLRNVTGVGQGRILVGKDQGLVQELVNHQDVVAGIHGNWVLTRLDV